MSGLNLNDEALQAVVAKSIIENLTPERQQEILATAVKALINDKTSTAYGTAEIIAHEKVKNDPELRAAIDKLFMDSWKKLTEGDNYNTLVGKISDAMATALTNNGRY